MFRGFNKCKSLTNLRFYASLKRDQCVLIIKLLSATWTTLCCVSWTKKSQQEHHFLSEKSHTILIKNSHTSGLKYTYHMKVFNAPILNFMESIQMSSRYMKFPTVHFWKTSSYRYFFNYRLPVTSGNTYGLTLRSTIKDARSVFYTLLIGQKSCNMLSILN